MPFLEQFYNIGQVLLSADFKVISMNELARKVLGPDSNVLGKSIYHFHSSASRKKISKILEETEEDQSDFSVAKMINIGNNVLMTNISRLTFLEKNCNTRFIMTFIDVTKETGAERGRETNKLILKKIPIVATGSFFFLDVSSIYFFQADGNFTRIVTRDNSYYLYMSLKVIMKRYEDHRFFRTHKSYIVNLEHVDRLIKEKSGQTSVSFDCDVVPTIQVARRKFKFLKEALECF